MKKFILLFLILPLTLMARPRVEYQQRPYDGMLLASVTWIGTDLGDDLCVFTGTDTSYVTVDMPADDDCDDAARTCSGDYNATDCTCTDGSGSGCDGSYARIVINNIPAGKVTCNLRGVFTGQSVATGHRYGMDDNSSDAIIPWHSAITNLGEVECCLSFSWYYDSPQATQTYTLKETGGGGTRQVLVRNVVKERLNFTCRWYHDDRKKTVKKIIK